MDEIDQGTTFTPPNLGAFTNLLTTGVHRGKHPIGGNIFLS